MVEIKRVVTYHQILIISIVFLSVLLLTGCTKEKNVELHSQSEHEVTLLKKESIPYAFLGKDYIYPIKPKEGRFYYSSGWINDRTILYVTETGENSNLYAYDLQTGESDLFYKSIDPIVTIKISPSKQYVLIHSSPSTYEGLITVMDVQGKEVASKRIHSNELEFEWNPFEEDFVLISAFTENWDFSTYQFNLHDKSLTDIQLPNPFAYWVSKDEVVLLEWNENSPSFFANLMKQNIVSQTSEEISSNVYQLSSIGKKILKITVDDLNSELAEYTIYSNTFEHLKSFVIPHLTRFSDWLVPYYDFNEYLGKFLTFQPLYSGEVDTYIEGFELLSYDLDSDEHQLLLDGLNNEPLSCSPSGTLCLYGFYLEKLIDLKAKKIVHLAE